MKLRRLEIEHVRVLSAPAPIVVEFDDALTVISGPNESGKSTLADALAAALFARASSTAGPIRALRPHSNAIPRVSLTFDSVDAAGRAVTAVIVKTFRGQNGTTELTITPADGAPATHHTADDANAMLGELLQTHGAVTDIHKPHADLGPWTTLLVRQGASHADPAESVTEPAAAALTRLIAETTGAAIATERDQRIRHAVRERVGALFTDSGKAKKHAPSSVAARDLDAAEADAAALRTRLDARRTALDALEHATTSITTLSVQIPELEAAEARAAERVTTIERARHELDASTAKRDAARDAAARLDERAVERAARTEAVAEQRRAVESATAAERAAADAITRTEHAANAAETEANACTARADDAGRRTDRLRAALDARNARAAADRIAEATTRAADADTTCRQLRAAIDAAVITPERLETVRAAHDRLARAEAALEVAAAHLELTALRPTTLAIDDATESLAADDVVTRRVEADLTITIDDVVRLTLRPGGADLATLRQTTDAARRATRDALAAVNATSLDDAVRALAVVDEQRAALREADAVLRAHAPDGIAALRDRADELAARAAAADQRVTALTQPDDPPIDDDADDVALTAAGERSAADAAAARDTAQRATTDARHAAAALAAAREAHAASRSACDAAVAHLARADAALEQHGAAHGDDAALRDAQQHARRAAEACAAAHEERAAAFAALAPDDARLDLDRQRDAVRLARADLARAEAERHRAEGQLAAEDLMGIHEALGAADAAILEARERLERTTAHERAVQTLAAALEHAHQHEVDRLTAPLHDAVAPLLERLFDGTARVLLEPGPRGGFALQPVEQHGVPTPFETLSHGAREQIGVIVRLALACVLARDDRAGGQLPVVLDDALVNTDPVRMQRMLRVLTAVTGPLQLIVLTCDPAPYRGLGVPIVDLPELIQRAHATPE